MDASPEQLDAIVAFIRGVGIPVSTGHVEGGFLPGLRVEGGGIVYDPANMGWPGDLLHEAGHIAVTDPALRPTLDEVSSDPAEEMATIAWSYAAARAIRLPIEIVFHAAGYHGGGNWVAEAFANGGTIGQPMLHYWGMTRTERDADADTPPYPHMVRWLR